MCIELHYLHLFHLTEPPTDALDYCNSLLSMLQRITEFFDVIHMRPNNNTPFNVTDGNGSSHTLYTCIELTMLNKACRYSQPIPINASKLRNKLDSPNVTNKPDVDYNWFEAYYSKL